jgi:uncharacterized coiled-coil protein SlyX
VPRMGSFKRSLFGYRAPDVDAAISGRDAELGSLRSKVSKQQEAIDGHESETVALSGMVIEREREIRALGERLREAQECHERSIASLDAVTARLEEMQSQARGQATRIRMKALSEAVEVSRRVEALKEATAGGDAGDGAGDDVVATNGNGNGNGLAKDFDGLFEGQIKLEVGPLGDFSQLVGFEDAVGRLGASEILVERFSEGRATFSMRLDEPVELLRELEDLSALDFKVRHTAPDNLILDVDDDDGPEQRAA